MGKTLGSSIRSDSLPSLRQYFGTNAKILELVGSIFQAEVIVDANVIISELIWLTRTRKNPQARTNLLELLHAETLIACAPGFLDTEIRRKLPSVARKEHIPTKTLRDAWEQYRPLIRFYHIDEPDGCDRKGIRDPKDLPYLHLQQRLRTPIYSNDLDIKGMGGRVVGPEIMVTLKDYSRAASIDFTLKYASIVLTGVTFEVAKAAWQLVERMAGQARRIPPWILITGAGILMIAVLHPKSRAYLREVLASCNQEVSEAAIHLMEVAMPIMKEASEAKRIADKTLLSAREHLRDRSTRSDCEATAEDISRSLISQRRTFTKRA